jgi:transposase
MAGGASCLSPVAQRARRDVTRDRRPGIQARVTRINRVSQLLEDANLKLAAVASDMMGVSGRALLAALLTGHANPQALAESAKGRLRRTRAQLTKALEGRGQPQHRVVLTE